MHKHEWAIDEPFEKAICITTVCKETLSVEKIVDRLNATEELSAEDAQRASEILWNISSPKAFVYHIDALRAYAERMEDAQAN